MFRPINKSTILFSKLNLVFKPVRLECFWAIFKHCGSYLTEGGGPKLFIAIQMCEGVCSVTLLVEWKPAKKKPAKNSTKGLKL